LRIIGNQLCRGVQPFLFVVAEVEAGGDGIHGVGKTQKYKMREISIKEMNLEEAAQIATA
jgi:hypothetical protein